MKRRNFMKRAGLAAAAGAASTTLAAPAIAQERFELNLVMPWPKGTPGVGVNAERFVQRVTAMSGGRIVDHGTPHDLLTRYGRETMEDVFLDIARDRRDGSAQAAQ